MRFIKYNKALKYKENIKSNLSLKNDPSLKNDIHPIEIKIENTNLSNDESVREIIRTNMNNINSTINIESNSKDKEDLNSELSDTFFLSSDNDNIAEWNSKLEEEIIKLSKICEKEGELYKTKSNSFTLYGKSLQTLLIILGTCSVYISSADVSIEVKNVMNIIFGSLTTIVSAVYSVFGFSKKGMKYKEVSTGLDNLSRLLRCETYKPYNSRRGVNELFLFAEVTRDKYLKKIDSE
jgi:hypothetical protein